MPKKPRQQVQVMHYKTREALAEFRNCDAPGGCPNIVSVKDRPRREGPIYCRLHAHLAEKA
jgi:hypothetical protein